MKQFKGLVKKEWNTYKSIFLWPIWLTASFYAMIISVSIYGYIKNNFVLNFPSNFDISKANLFFYFSSKIMTIIPFALMVLFLLKIINNMMNDDFKNKCAIFHLAQPVSLTKIIGAKLFLLLAGGLTIPFGIALFNQIVYSTLFKYYVNANVKYGFLALLQCTLIVLLPMLFVITFKMMCDTIFQKKNQLVVAVIFLIEMVIKIVNAVWKIHLPSLIGNIVNLIIGKTIVYPYSMDKINNQIISGGEFTLLRQSIEGMLINLFDPINLWRIALSVLFIIITYYVYKQREIA
ncbi:MAG TPA: hypothetical protein PLH63_09630 [Candidatus Cloacimonadota bacterium]|nr:hypothetical protein [Candidatus Cloacimonadota bacterium]